MQTNVEKLDKTLVAIEVGFDPAEVDQALSQAYARVVRKVKIPGFRQGKVPRPVLEAHYGKEILYEDAKEIIVSKAYHDALKEHSLEPIDQPEVNVLEPLEQGKPFVFQARVRVLPEVKLGTYTGLRVEKPVPVIDDAAVAGRLEALRERYAELVPADRDELAAGDFAVVDFDGYIDGQPFPGGSAKGHTVEIGADGYLPGFTEGMIGMKQGETKEIPVHVPEDYHRSDLAGKDLVFQVKLHEIKVKDLPELDEEFAKSLGRESLADLSAAVKSSLQSEAEKEAEGVFAGRVLAAAVAQAEVEVPSLLIDRAVERNYQRLLRNLSYQGIPGEKYLATIGKTEDEIKAELRPGAENEVREALVIEAIRKAEGIEPDEDEIAAKISELAAVYQAKDPAKFRRDLEKSGGLQGVIDALAREKTVRYLVDKAEAVPVSASGASIGESTV